MLCAKACICWLALCGKIGSDDTGVACIIGGSGQQSMANAPKAVVKRELPTAGGAAKRKAPPVEPQTKKPKVQTGLCHCSCCGELSKDPCNGWKPEKARIFWGQE